MSAPPSSVWVIGSSNVDLIMKMARLPDRGETITNAEFTQTFGGKGANSAVACARAGAPTVFVNAVGSDPYAPTLLEYMTESGVDVQHVRRETDVPTGHALVMIGGNGDNYLSVAPGANYRLFPEHIVGLEEKIASASRILIQNEIPPETNRAVREVAAKHGIPISWNFAPAITVDPAEFQSIETLIVNETEADAIAEAAALTLRSGKPEALAGALRTLGPARVIITLGAAGAVAATVQGTQRIPSLPVHAVDTTGAGDTFCGALAAALATGKDIAEALGFASTAAALSVTRLGAQPSCPTRTEILEAITKLQSKKDG
jgi:ribokinase